MRVYLFLISTLMGLNLRGQDTARTQATMNKATVYFGYGAELSHEAKATVSATTRFIIIDQLSTSLDVGSLQVSCPEDVSILSQQFLLYTPPSTAPVKSREQLQAEDSLRILSRDVLRIENKIQIEQETMNKTGLLIEATLGGQGGKNVTSAEVLKLV
ncbi:MAG: DUF4140 domain-containing protein, partial [Chitinophagaceae bacterium]|nr:DUF4140 domain-containing protein [Chitinophagaceae bacterium]